MTYYKFNLARGLAFSLLIALGAALVLFNIVDLPRFFTVLSITGAIAWSASYFTWTIGVASESISSLYTIFGFTLKVRTCLPFTDIEVIMAGPRNSVIVAPTKRAADGYAKVIVIQSHIERRSELLRHLLRSVNPDKITKEVWTMSQQDIEHVPPVQASPH